MSAAKRYGMVVDTRRCVGCSACVLACMAENDTPEGTCRDWIVHEVKGVFPDLEQEIRSERCMHCSSPPCVDVCPTGASFVGDGGVVLVEPDKCTGCKACIAACPYDARYVHPRGYVDKCTFCIHRVRRGELPACVTVCPTKALTFGDLDDPESEVSELLRTRKSKVLLPEAGTEPNVFFLT
ncbi:MAG: 4Fe-4S dicluster domain-containing protein [Deltaproteobacteria bacterium]|nr:4Fe-4S dicluster domain-containing protein [Deltaproteobacteria bacterium]